MSGTIENAYANFKKKALVVGIYALKVPIFYNNHSLCHFYAKND